MKTCAEVSEYLAGAAESLGDPSIPVCQLFVRWRDHLSTFVSDDLVCGWGDGELALFLGSKFPPLPMSVEGGAYRMAEDGRLRSYGLERITAGVWAIDPSLYIEGGIHAFLVLYDVPDPAPWDRKIVLP